MKLTKREWYVLLAAGVIFTIALLLFAARNSGDQSVGLGSPSTAPGRGLLARVGLVPPGL